MIVLLMCMLIHQGNGLIARPTRAPRGWNSYDSIGASNESTTLTIAEIMKDKLLSFGYEYVVIDAGWYGGTEDASIDEYGRLIPLTNQYPSSANGKGFGPLAAQIHGMGLKFGFWNTFGIPTHAVNENTPIKGTTYRARDISLGVTTTCPWYQNLTYAVNTSHPAAQAYFDSVVELYDQWQIDLLKQDCSFGGNLSPAHWSNVQAFSASLSRSNRSYVYSMSPGGDVTPDMVDLIRPKATMARITNDFWDVWDNDGKRYPMDIPRHFDMVAELVNNTQAGFYFDLDMLPFGKIGRPPPCSGTVGCYRESKLTESEQRSVMTLWSIAQSPLIYGGDLRASTQAQLDMITNPNILTAQANSRHARRVVNQTSYQILPECGDGCEFVEAWSGTEYGKGATLPVKNLQGHDALLFQVTLPRKMSFPTAM
eukprot:TRINITY_DN12186_c2_g1_i3.p1 TRINITY_DN12186_c2_g1~~TRINITY_DN12186_c2_g1_i3.p1  ORF type:complete len:425 (+),score=92.39 TRINITY_DN12186_c2_g1_i3:158-1432(+)